MLAIIYTFETTILLIPWGIGGVALLTGFILLRWSIDRIYKILPFVFAIVALGIGAPSMHQDMIEITSDSFYLRTGFWWSPTEHQFAFKDAQTVDVIVIPDLKGRQKDHLHVKLKNGTFAIIPMGTLFRLNQGDILKAVADAMTSAD